MNLTPSQIVVVGGGIVFGIPIALGLVVAHFFGGLVGLATGVLLFAIIITVAHRKLMKVDK
jgi:hypothetical protein